MFGDLPAHRAGGRQPFRRVRWLTVERKLGPSWNRFGCDRVSTDPIARVIGANFVPSFNLCFKRSGR